MSGSNDDARRRRGEALFWGFALFSLLLFLGRGTWNAAEGQLAEAVREMLLSGNFRQATLNWQPIGYRFLPWCWLSLPLALLFGLEEFSLRLIGTGFAVLALYGNFVLAARWFDRRTALLANWMLLACGAFWFGARSATWDMAVTAWFLWLTIGCLQWRERASFLLAFVCAAAFALGGWLFGPVYWFWFLCWSFPLLFRRGGIPKDGRLKAFSGIAAALLSGLLLYFVWRRLGLPHPLWHGQGIVAALTAAAQRLANLRIWVNAAVSWGRLLLPWSWFFLWALIFWCVNRQKLPAELRTIGLGALLSGGLLTLFRGGFFWRGLLPVLPLLVIFGAGALTSECPRNCRRETVIKLLRLILAFLASLALASPLTIPLRRLWELPALASPGVWLLLIGSAVVLLLLIFDDAEDDAVAKFFGLPGRLTALAAGSAVLTLVLLCLPLFMDSRGHDRARSIGELGRQLAEMESGHVIYYDRKPDAVLWFYLNLHHPIEVAGRDRETAMQTFVDRNRSGQVAVVAKMRPERLLELTRLTEKTDLRLSEDTAFWRETPQVFPAPGQRHLAWRFEIPPAETGRRQ